MTYDFAKPGVIYAEIHNLFGFHYKINRIWDNSMSISHCPLNVASMSANTMMMMMMMIMMMITEPIYDT